MAKVMTEPSVHETLEVTETVSDQQSLIEAYENDLKKRDLEIHNLNSMLDVRDRTEDIAFQQVSDLSQEVAHLSTLNGMMTHHIIESHDKRTKELAIMLGAGVTAAGTIGILAYLRERKVRKHIVKMIEDFTISLEEYHRSDVKTVELSAFCFNISNSLLESNVRSLTNPFGIKYEEAKHVAALLNSLVIFVDQIKTTELNLSPVNAEDIEAQVTIEPVEPNTTKKEGK